MMEDLYLEADVGTEVIFVTTLSQKMYRQANGQGLGGAEGYFICASDKCNPDASFEILAKARTFEAAQILFEALTSKLSKTAA
jgi:hypothetical protein